MDVFPACQLGENSVALFIESDRFNFLAEAEYRSQLPQLEAQTFHNLPIHKIEQGGTLIEQGNFYPKGSEHRSVFQSDYAGAHHNQVSRDFLQTMDLIGIKDSMAVHGDVGAVRGPRAAGDQDVLATNQLRAFVAFNFQGIGIEKTGVTFQNAYVVAAQLGLDDFDFARHH